MSRRLKTRIAFKLCLALLPLLVVTFSALGLLSSAPKASGRWVLSEAQDCPPGLVCTEWELASGEKKGVFCCQEASLVGSRSFNSCGSEQSQFRQ